MTTATPPITSACPTTNSFACLAAKGKNRFYDCKPVFRIHDILVWIRIRILILDPDPAIFVIDLQDANKKLNILKKFSAYYFLNVHLHHFSKKKVKKSHNVVRIKVFITIFA